MAKANAQAFVDFLIAREKAKDGYIMGAIGQNPRALSEWYFSGQYSGDRLKKARYWRDNSERVWDCQGLSEGYLNDVLGTKINVRARDNYATWCDPKGTGTIPASKRVPGAAVFTHNGSYISHVGYLVKPVVIGNPAGDWYVVEAAGVMKGVITSRLSGGYWNRWGWMTKYFDYGQAQTEPDGALRIGDTGDAVKAMQSSLIALGYSCGRWGADGEFGSATLAALTAFQTDQRIGVNGVYDERTKAALDKALPDEPEPTPAEKPAPAKPTALVRIINGNHCYVRAAPNTSGAILGVTQRGDTHEHLGEVTASGWHLIRYGDEQGWVSGKYSEVVQIGEGK